MQILLSWTGLAIAMMVTDTLLLSTLGVKYLPAALLLTSFLTFSSSLAYTALLGRYQSPNLLGASLATGGVVLLGAFAGLKLGASWLCLPLLAFYGASFSMLATQSFGLASECIDTYSSKRLFPLLTVGATCGELLGGLLVAVAARRVDPAGWVLVWSAFNWLALLWLLFHRSSLAQWRQAGAPPGRQPYTAVFQYLCQAPMARALTLLLLGMVLCQGTSQYLFSQVFARSFPNSRDLAHFLGQLMAVTNLAELAIATQVTPRLVQWLGVARAGWLHPLLMLSGLSLLSTRFSLGPAIWLWISRRTLQDSLATPVRNLLYNAIPPRVRGHLRAFLDGLVVATSQACVALLLLILQRFWAAEQIVYFAIFLGLIYLAGALGASRNYLQTLVGELQTESLRIVAQPTSQPTQPSFTESRSSLARLAPELQRAEVMQELASHSDPMALQMLAGGLSLPAAGGRHLAARLLGARSDAGVRAALPFLFSDQTATVEAALEVLGRSRTAWGCSLLQGQFACRARAAARAWLAAYQLQDQSLPGCFLKLALRQECLRHQRLAFRALHWLEGEELVDTLRLSVRSRGGRGANALEVLSNLGERQVATLFVSLLENNSDSDRARLLLEGLDKGASPDPALSDDHWVRWAAVRRPPSTRWELGKMEQLLALSQTPPFHRLDLDELEIVRLRMQETRWIEDRTLWQAGDLVTHGYVPLDGHLEPGFYGGVELAGQLPARTHLATRGRVRLLRLEASHWEPLVRSLPGLALGTFQWLSAELRRAEKSGS